MSFEKTVIDEANRHLAALSDRVEKLESTVQEQAKQLMLKDKIHQETMDALCQKKDAEIAKLNVWLESTQAEIRRMQIHERQQNMIMSHLKHRCSILENASKYTSNLEGLLTCLMEAEKLCSVNYEDLVKRQMSDVSQYGVGDGHHDRHATVTHGNHNPTDNDSCFTNPSLGECSSFENAKKFANGGRFSITEDSDT
uniref:Uncharacterized protein LOC100186116 n=1 Tax=Phallusia mammillata TaxID=59560 RepID=A0A6F9DHP2_9ASCI|nr:uncharacterized protein LOC100186116 [Phallusia mammillata]